MKVEYSKNLALQLILLAVLAGVIWSNIHWLRRNYVLGKRADGLQTELIDKKERNTRLKLLAAYYQSTQFRDVEARRRLSVKLPDEKVLVVKGLPEPDIKDPLTGEVYAKPMPESENKEGSSLANAWWQYFFGK